MSQTRPDSPIVGDAGTVHTRNRDEAHRRSTVVVVTFRLRTAALALVAAVVAVLGVGIGTLTPAHAATSNDSIDSYVATYRVAADGVTRVKETITYRFGPGSGRHGIYRNLVTREPYVDENRNETNQDQLYQVSNVSVSSPTPGVSTDVTQKTLQANNAREQNTQLRIGSADRTVAADTAVYVISYDVRGALRHFADHSEFYWDVTGFDWDVTEINDVSVTVTVPKGVTQAGCFAGDLGSATPCTDHSISTAGVASYRQTHLDTGENLTVDAGITAGAVTNDTPVLADPPGLLARNGIGVPAAVGAGLVSVVAAVGALLYSRLGNKDRRYAGLPPGTFAPPGVEPAVVKDTLTEDQIPVAFAPPSIPVAEAGLLIDSTIDSRETAATLIDLAVRGGVRIIDQDDEQSAELVDPRVATVPHEQALMNGLFPGLAPGTTVTLSRGKVGDNTMYHAHTATVAAVRNQVEAQGWYDRMPSAGRGRRGGGAPRALLGCGVVLAFFIVSSSAGVASAFAGGGAPKLVLALIPVVAVIGALVVYSRIRGRGRRSPVGRALDDQAIGFRRYLATAEAGQLRFEEGEDIFSRYLPWAIAFDLADRWQKVCQELVAQGRIPASPGWYSGPSYYTNPFLFSAFASDMGSTFSPPPTPSSGGGGGSSSGFSGGGFSGGGGGGGGGGSW